MSGTGFSIPIKTIRGATPAPSALYEELYGIIEDNVRRVAKGKPYKQVTADFLSIAREDGQGTERSIDFGFHDSGGLCSASVQACDHWFTLFVSALAKPRAKGPSPLDEIAARHGLAIAKKPPLLAAVLKTCLEPLVELRGHLFGIGVSRRKPYLVSDELDEDRIEIEDLTAKERAKVDALVKKQRCTCAVCEALRTPFDLTLPKAKKRAATKAKSSKLAVKSTLSDDKLHRSVYDDTCTGLPDAIFAPPTLQGFSVHAPITTIPDGIARLGSLRRLNVYATKLTRLPEVLTRMPSLVELSIGRTPLESLESLESLPWLESIRLDGSDLGKSIHDVAFGRFSKLASVQLLWLGIEQVPPKLLDATTLRALNLNDERLRAIPSLDRLTKLERLELTVHGVETLPSLAKLEALRELTIESRSLRAIPALPRGLRELRIEGEQIDFAPSSFADLDALEVLHMKGSFVELPAAVGRLGALRELLIVAARLASIAAGALPRSLTELSIFWSPELAQLPDAIGDLVELRRLALRGTALESLPDAVRALRKLETLDLAHNARFRALPSWIGELASLEHLDLSQLPALGPLPESTGQLEKLTYLNLQEAPGAFPLGKFLSKLPIEYLVIARSKVSKDERARMQKLLPKAKIA